MESKFTQEDLTTKDAIGVIIYDENGNILIQDHVKLDFFTIPIGKVKGGESIEEVMKAEIFEETNLKVLDFRKIIEKEGIYDYNGIKVRLINHIFEVLSYEGELINKEPSKHRSSTFMHLDDIRKLPKISDATTIFLNYKSC